MRKLIRSEKVRRGSITHLVVVFSLLWSSLSITLLYKVTTKLYNENGNDGGYGEFLIIIESQTIITDNSLFTSCGYLTSTMPTILIYIGARTRAMIMVAIHPSKPRQLANSRAGR